MEKLLVAVFENEAKALEGARLLWELDREGEISVYALQTVAKEPDGSLCVIDNTEVARFPMLAAGTAVGALIGLLGGPVGAIFGATAGAIVGLTGSIMEEAGMAGVTDEFVGDVSTALTPGKVAVIADIAEEWMTPVDTRMERIGGVVFRRSRSFVKTTQEDRDAAEHRAAIEQLKVEREKAKSGRLAKIDTKIDNLRAKLEAAVERKRIKMQLRQQRREARIQVLQTKADQAKGEVRQRQESRIAELRRDYAEKAAVG
jgi:uncharacterized membrane protein